MKLIDALITLELSPLDAMDALNHNYQLAHAACYGDADDEGFEVTYTLGELNDAYQTLEDAIRSDVDRTDCIQTSTDLNKFLHVLAHTQYNDLFESIGEKINQIVRSEIHLKQTLAGLNEDKLTESTLLLNKNLPLFGVFAKGIGREKSPSLPNKTLEAIHEDPKHEEKPRMVSSPTQPALLNFFTQEPSPPPPMHKALNRTVSLNSIKRLLSVTALYAEQPLSLLIDALHSKDLKAIASAYEALIEEQTSLSPEKVDCTVVGARISAYSMLYIALSKPNALNYALRAAAGVGILYELYANKDHFLSGSETDDIEEKLIILTNALSQMDMEFKLDLNQALKLNLSRTALADDDLLQEELMEYSAKAVGFHPEYDDSSYQAFY
jgi:hypothetical protein